MTKLKVSTLAGIAGLFAVTACTDINTPTNDPNQRTGEGAGIGAIFGAIAGIARGDNARERREGAVVGAILGGAAGAAIGSGLDKQAADLQASISNDRIQIINTGNELIVRMPQDILFAVDSSRVQAPLRADLADLARHLMKYPGSTVEVVGHTDRTGTAEHNQTLSIGRANAVASVLIANGVPGSRIRTVGMGEQDPIATNLTAAGRAQNRRVDIVIRPQG